MTPRKVVVTGAASGIGRMIALTFAGSGAAVVCLDVNQKGAEETVAAIAASGGTGLVVHADIADFGAVERAFAEVDEALGEVDVLVNNAFRGSHARPEDLDPEEWAAVLAVNVTGAFHCARAAGRRMIERGTGGVIVNLSSVAGTSALGRGNLAYSVSKGAIDTLTRELAVEWAPHGIRVNAVKPAQTRTPALEELIANPSFDSDALMEQWLRGIPLGRLPEPQDVAAAVLFLASDQARMITGALLPVDGGNLALNAGGSVSW